MFNPQSGPSFAHTLIRRADATATTLAVTLLAAIGLAAVAPEADARVATASAKAKATTGGGAVAGTPLSEQTAPGAKATVTSTGLAIPPADAPAPVKAAILAGNKIAKTPYKWGGGHGRHNDTGYDCSGSVSYALRNAKLMTSSMVSGAFAAWGHRGRGDWITIRANAGHVYMVIAGVRFDTSASKRGGSRWTTAMRSARGFVATHPPGL